MKAIRLNKTEQIAALLILIGSILRFWGFWSWSLSNDELSALNRLNFDGLSELINKGIRPDGHPAFTQIFLFYWTALFGSSTFILRLPFVLAGISSLYFFYRLARKLISDNAALIALGIFAISYPFILYSQLARPYSFGILFVLAFAYHALNIKSNPHSWLYRIAFVLFGYFALITHYFAAFQIVLLLFLHLLSLNKKNYKSYIACSLAIALLFLPHLSISLDQISIGGVYWIPEPEGGYVFRFIKYMTNSSSWLLKLLYALPFIALIFSFSAWKKKRQGMLLMLFLVPYFTAYFYSIHKSPLLQFSILLYAAPFLILFFCSFFSLKLRFNYALILIGIISLLGLESLIFGTQLYSKKPFASFKEVAQKLEHYQEKYGDDILIMSNASNPEYLEFFFDKNQQKPNIAIASFDSSLQTVQARNLIQSSQKPYVALGFSGVSIPEEVHEYTKENYPSVLARDRYFNSEVILYSNTPKKRESFFYSHYEDLNPNWQFNLQGIQDSIYRIPPTAYKVERSVEFPITYQDTVKNLYNDQHNFLTVKCWIKANNIKEAKLVLSIERNEEVIDWQGINIADYHKTDDWFELIYVYENRYFVESMDKIKVYVWNLGKEEFYIDDFEIVNFTDSDYNYYEL